MQNKGAISFFAILLSLVCLYELSFTYVSNKVEKDAWAYAGGDSAKARTYLDSIANEVVYLGKTYSEVKEKEINLGLDLKGGMNVMLEVSVADVVRTMANNSQDPTFTKAIEQAQAEQRKNGGDFVTLFANAAKQIDPNVKFDYMDKFEQNKITELLQEMLLICLRCNRKLPLNCVQCGLKNILTVKQNNGSHPPQTRPNPDPLRAYCPVPVLPQASHPCEQYKHNKDLPLRPLQ
jgi:hypothetical protein